MSIIVTSRTASTRCRAKASVDHSFAPTIKNGLDWNTDETTAKGASHSLTEATVSFQGRSSRLFATELVVQALLVGTGSANAMLWRVRLVDFVFQSLAYSAAYVNSFHLLAIILKPPNFTKEAASLPCGSSSVGPNQSRRYFWEFNRTTTHRCHASHVCDFVVCSASDFRSPLPAGSRNAKIRGHHSRLSSSLASTHYPMDSLSA